MTHKNKHNKLLAGLLCIGIITLFFLGFIRNDRAGTKSENLTPRSVSVLSTLPQDWNITEQATDGSFYKVEKESDSAIVPTIVMIKSNLPEQTDLKEYIDSLIKGAKSTIPSLVFTDDQESEKDPHQRQLKGYYYIGKTKINITQRLFTKDGCLYTINASFSNTDLSQDVEEIIANLIEKV